MFCFEKSSITLNANLEKITIEINLKFGINFFQLDYVFDDHIVFCDILLEIILNSLQNCIFLIWQWFYFIFYIHCPFNNWFSDLCTFTYFKIFNLFPLIIRMLLFFFLVFICNIDSYTLLFQWLSKKIYFFWFFFVLLTPRWWWSWTVIELWLSLGIDMFLSNILIPKYNFLSLCVCFPFFDNFRN